MDSTDNYLQVNQQHWDACVDQHMASNFYDLTNFVAGETSLKEIELALLGDISGNSLLHLQCHFGQDSISLARMGALVTAIDFSKTAIARAKELAVRCGQNIDFHCCNVYDTAQHVQQQFDIVFTTYGTIGWLPDIDRWAAVVAQHLKPGGRLVFVEFHPVVWMYDNDFTHVQYAYSKGAAIVEESLGTYAQKDSEQRTTNITWNHGLAEVISALLAQGLVLDNFQEYNYSPYSCFAHYEPVGPSRYQIPQFGNKIPLVYSLALTKQV
jgi:2-polyprenyl-3-methyl-5-hydroxy-6-metoxy-1,4-benzoquinol methylase